MKTPPNAFRFLPFPETGQLDAASHRKRPKMRLRLIHVFRELLAAKCSTVFAIARSLFADSEYWIKNRYGTY
jgi:hypothetical protein